MLLLQEQQQESIHTNHMRTWNTKSGYRVIQVLSVRSNVFLLSNGEKNLLIDTSTDYMWNLLVRRLAKLNVENIDYLILTHSHWDHAANSNRIKEKYKTRVIIHKAEALYLTTGQNIVPDGTNFFSHVLMKMAKYLAPKTGFTPCRYDYAVDVKYDLNDLGFNAYILHTPGHSPGSMSVIIDNEVALVGDCMFGVFKGSVFPPFATDAAQMIESWGKLLATNCSVFIPSHGTANSRTLVQKDFNKRIAS